MLAKMPARKKELKLNKNQRMSLSTWQEEFSERMSLLREATDLHESRPSGSMKDGTKQLLLKAILKLRKLWQIYTNRHTVKSSHSNVELLMQKHKLLQLPRNVNKICLLLQRKQRARKERKVKRMKHLQKRLMRHPSQQKKKNKKTRNLTLNTQLNLEKHSDKDIQDHSLSDHQNSKTSIYLRMRYLSTTKMPDKPWLTDLTQQLENQSSA